jgi:hypothetical protein
VAVVVDLGHLLVEVVMELLAVLESSSSVIFYNIIKTITKTNHK